MRSILENAVIHHLNGDSEKAFELFHQFIVARARQINEAMRNGDEVLPENFDEEPVSETHYDLSELEDDVADDVDGAVDAIDGDLDGEVTDGDVVGDEDEGLGDFDAEPEEDDLGGEPSLSDLEDRIADMMAELEALTAEVEAVAGEDEGNADDFGADAPVEDDMGDPMADGEIEAPANADEEFSDEEFDEIAESVTSELEKIEANLKADGKEIGAGGSFAQQKRTALPQKSKDARQGGAPVHLKSSQHKGFERETAPAVADMKKRKNTLAKGKDALGAVAAPKKGEGQGVGAGGKTASVNTKSPTSGKK